MPFGTGLWEGWRYFLAGRQSSGSLWWLQMVYGAARQCVDLMVLASYPLSAVVLVRVLWRNGGTPRALLLPRVLAGLWIASFLTAMHRPAMLNLSWGFFAPLLVLLTFGAEILPAPVAKRSKVGGYALLLPFVVMILCDNGIFPLLRPGERISTPAGGLMSPM